MKSRAAALPAADDFDRQAIDHALTILEHCNARICERMLRDTAARGVALETWAAANAPELLAAKPLLAKVLAEPGLSISRLGVIADSLRGVA